MAENPFRFVNDILQDKKYIMTSEEEEKGYNPFLINRSLSMHIDCILHVAEIAKYSDIPNKWAFDYYFNAIRKAKRRFQKWPKKVTDEDLEVIQEYYRCNRQIAEDYLTILKPEDLDSIRKDMEKGGIGK